MIFRRDRNLGPTPHDQQYMGRGRWADPDSLGDAADDIDDYWRQVAESQQHTVYDPGRDAAHGLDWCGHPAPCPYCHDDPGRP
jgi:hypothetical protein